MAPSESSAKSTDSPECNPFPYRAKCLRWLREEYTALPGSARKTVDRVLAGTGCETLLRGGLAARRMRASPQEKCSRNCSLTLHLLVPACPARAIRSAEPVPAPLRTRHRHAILWCEGMNTPTNNVLPEHDEGRPWQVPAMHGSLRVAAAALLLLAGIVSAKRRG